MSRRSKRTLVRSKLNWLRSIWHDAWTKELAYVKMTVGASGFLVAWIGQILNNGDVKSAIEALHLDPRIMLGLAILGVLTFVSAEH